MDRAWGAWLAVVIGITSPAITTRNINNAGPVAQNSTSSASRPIPELQFSQLKADAILALTLEPGTALAPDGLWVPQRQGSAVVRVDAKTNALEKPISVGSPPCASLAVAFESVWAPLCEVRRVARVAITSGNVSASAPMALVHPSSGFAVAVGSVWAPTDAKGVIVRIDPATNAPVAEVYVAAKPFGVAAADDVVWVTSEAGDLLTRINAHTNVVEETVKVGLRPGRVVIGEGAVWTLNRGDGSLSRVDSKTSKLVTTIAVGPSVADGDLAVGEGSVWISAPGVPITRIDPRSNRVVQRFVGDGGGAIVVGHGSLWVAAGPMQTWRLDPKLVVAMRP
jgi:streptogramin lyase